MLGLVGNDVVDLTLEGAVRKSQDQRFLERVFTPAERQTIQLANAPDLVLWALWAAKEAGFKLVQKTAQDTVFSPQSFTVNGNPESSTTGEVIFDSQALAVTWDLGADRVHALATKQTMPSKCLCRVELVQSQQNNNQPLQESLEVRRLAQRLLAELGWPATHIERQRSADGRLLWPVVYAGPTMLPVDLSLSHDGNYVAVAICPHGS